MGPLSRCLSILVYHRVVPEPDPLVPDHVCAREFDWHLAALERWFTVLPLREAAARLRGGTLPARSACVTFDDGYADNVTVALPILRRRGVPATFFLATSFIDGGRMWNDSVIEAVRGAQGETLDARCAGLDALGISTIGLRRQAIERVLAALKYLPLEERQRRVEELAAQTSRTLPSDLMMTAEQARHLHASDMEIGAHTVTHPILAQLDPERAESHVSAATVHPLGQDSGQVCPAAISQHLSNETGTGLSADLFEFSRGQLFLIRGIHIYPRLSGFICVSKRVLATALGSTPSPTFTCGLSDAPSFSRRALISFSTSTRVRTSATKRLYGTS